jgi:hypothetical protein
MARQNAAGLELDDSIQSALGEYVGRKGIHKKELVRRVMTWFLQQSPIVQRVAMLDIDAGMEGDYANALRKMADDTRDGVVRSPEFSADQEANGQPMHIRHDADYQPGIAASEAPGGAKNRHAAKPRPGGDKAKPKTPIRRSPLQGPEE